MKFYWGLAPKAPTHLVDAHRLVFDYKKIQLWGGLIALLVMLPLAWGAWRMHWPNSVIFGVFKQGPFVFMGLLAGIVMAHEFCHLLAQPMFGMGPRSYVGFDPKSGSPYAGYTGIVSRKMLIVMLLTPFIALSFGTYALALAYPQWASYLAWCSIINAIGSVGDLFYASLVLFKLPKDVSFQDGSYGKLPDPVHPPTNTV